MFRIPTRKAEDVKYAVFGKRRTFAHLSIYLLFAVLRAYFKNSVYV
jgi:hypothetical protein